MWATIYECTDGRRLPIGRPIPNTTVYLLDDRLQPVPVGVPGELYIGGIGLARGYLNQPELTAERFVPSPFAVSSQQSAVSSHGLTGDWRLATGERLYKTGDLARYLPDGNIEYLGRADHQVKLRGFRIELGEIEAALLRHTAVREAVVLMRASDETAARRPHSAAHAGIHNDLEQDVALPDQRLVAYVIPRTAPDNQAAGDQVGLWPSVADLKAHLRKSLPKYMIPAAIVALNAMPLTPNGKLDRAALPAPSAVRPDLTQAFVTPQTAVEQSFAALWREVLQTEHDLGGHSLLLAQVHSKIRRMFDSDLSLVDMFKYSTVHLLARRISQAPAEQLHAAFNDDREAQSKAGRSRMQQRRASQRRASQQCDV